MDETTGQLLNYRQLTKGNDRDTWIKACANDFGRLAQGVGKRMPTGTNTIFFIPRHKVPAGRKVSYINPVASMRPNKAEIHRVRLTAGGDRLDFPGSTATATVGLTLAKILFNSVVSTPNAKFLSADIKDYYYGTPLTTQFEYLCDLIKLILQEIILD